MGQVYLAISPGGRLVAVKQIRPELAEERGFRARFAREIAAARNVSGMYTAVVVDSDPTAEPPWMATAYVPGPSLADAIADDGPLPVHSVLALAAGLAEALVAIHGAGVIHRDLKPSNVLLAADGPRVIDFGISRALEQSMLTTTGAVLGSPGFMSPEQARGLQDVGEPTDVFSLGAVLAYAATGGGPFGVGPTPALLYRVVNEEPKLDRVPARLRPLIERCLAKDPAGRPTPADILGLLGDEVDALTGTWLPEALADSVRGYSLTIETPAPPPPVPGPPEQAAVAPEVSAWLAPAPDPRPVTAEGSGTAAASPAEADEATRDIPADAGITIGAAATAPATSAAQVGQSSWTEPPTDAGQSGRADPPAVPVPVALAGIQEKPSNAATAADVPGAGGAVEPPGGRAAVSRRRRWWIGAAAAVVVVVVTAVIAVVEPGGGPRPASRPAPSPVQIAIRSPSSPATTAEGSTESTTAKRTKPPSKPSKTSGVKSKTHASPTPRTAPDSPAPATPAQTTAAAAPPAPTSAQPTVSPPTQQQTTPPPSGPQVITSYSGADSAGCSVYGSVGSVSGGSSAGYSFTNDSGTDIQVWYITTSASGELEGTVTPGNSFGLSAKTGQDWMVANSGGGCLDIFTITGGGQVTVGT
jgi:eukaryotic-like serine/threonine-protein kinase